MENLYPSLPLYHNQEGWIIKYPEFSALADDQMHSFWPWDEPAVDNDIQDLRTKLTQGELHGLTEILKLFTLYERRIGEDYWSRRVSRTFHRPEILRMSTLFSAVEENSHAPIYNKVNEVLYLDDEEFYNYWKESKELSSRIKFVADSAADSDDAKSFAAFTFIEGAVLYSSFAFIKHFQVQDCGKNLMKNICRGVDLSVADEHQHSLGGALLFHYLCKEMLELHNIDVREKLKDTILQMARTVYEHESSIIDLVFKYEIKGINAEDLRAFVKSRIDLCLNNLGYEAIYNVQDNPIGDWFYKSINSKKLTDFFTGSGSEYNNNWDRQSFGTVWETNNV